MKKLTFCLAAIVIVSGALYLNSCKKDKKTEIIQEDPADSGPKFTIMTNAHDPKIVSADDRNGAIVDFYGARDINGIPLFINQVRIAKALDTTNFYLNEKGMPEIITTQDGTEFLFEWLSDSKAALTINANDGINQINTEIDINNPQKSSTNVTLEKKNINRKNIPLNLKLNPLNKASAQSKLSAVPVPAGTPFNCFVKVTSCGAPANANLVVVDVRELAGTLIDTYTLHEIEKGNYGITIPTNLAPSLNVPDVCNSVKDVLDNVCKVVTLPDFFFRVSAAAIIAGGPAVGIAIASMEAAAVIYCTVAHGTAPGADGSKDLTLADKLCKADFLNKTYKGAITVTAKAKTASSFGSSGPWKVSGDEKFPTFSIELGSKPYIGGLSLIPSSPADGVDYKAIATAFCLPLGSTVVLSVKGDDGYEDSINININSSKEEYVFELIVPGASTGVKDVVTIKITLPDGKIIPKMAYLTFT